MAEPDSEDPQAIQRRVETLTRRSLLTGAIVAGGMGLGWWWMRSRAPVGELAWPFRSVLEFNRGLAERAFSSGRLTPTYEGYEDQLPRMNEDIGLTSLLVPERWRLRVENTALAGGVRELTLADLRALPRTEFQSHLYCIEGWSAIGHWTGVRMVDFMQTFPPQLKGNGKLPRYVGFETPDREYYVGLDLASAMHPQTLLCYEMGARPLTPAHGAPLRLYTPVKYGIKNLKRIGRIFYTDERPRDYWAERGYDWYAGL